MSPWKPRENDIPLKIYISNPLSYASVTMSQRELCKRTQQTNMLKKEKEKTEPELKELKEQEQEEFKNKNESTAIEPEKKQGYSETSTFTTPLPKREQNNCGISLVFTPPPPSSDPRYNRRAEESKQNTSFLRVPPRADTRKQRRAAASPNQGSKPLKERKSKEQKSKPSRDIQIASPTQSDLPSQAEPGIQPVPPLHWPPSGSVPSTPTT